MDTGDKSAAHYPGNSCPYLRATNSPTNTALLGEPLPYGRASVRLVYRHARAVGCGRVFSCGLASFAIVVNSLRPSIVLRNLFSLRFDSAALANGPFDAPSRGTGVLKVAGYGVFSDATFEQTFVVHAKPRTPTGGGAGELGIDRTGIRKMLAAERVARGASRIGQFTVFAQFIVALVYLGRKDADGRRYLSIDDMRAMYRDLDLGWTRMR